MLRLREYVGLRPTLVGGAPLGLSTLAAVTSDEPGVHGGAGGLGGSGGWGVWGWG